MVNDEFRSFSRQFLTLSVFQSIGRFGSTEGLRD